MIDGELVEKKMDMIHEHLDIANHHTSMLILLLLILDNDA